MRCILCHRITTHYVWRTYPGRNGLVPACFDDRTCEAIVAERRLAAIGRAKEAAKQSRRLAAIERQQDPKMVLVRKHAARYVC